MASIEERRTNEGKTRYRVLVRLKGHPPQSATFERLTDARKWASKTETDIREGRYFRYSEAKRHTVDEMIDRYIREILPGKKKEFQAARTYQLEYWKEEIGSYTLAEASPAIIGAARDKLARTPARGDRERSAASVNRHLAALSSVFSLAMREWMWVDDTPMRKVTKFTEPRGRVRFLSDAEREAVLKACRESRTPLLYPLVVTALSTGARQGELLGIRWRDVDFHMGLIRLEKTKNNERRAIPLTGHAHELLKEMASVRRIDTDLVFPFNGGRHGLRSPWTKALKVAEIEDFRFHDLRHSAASYLAMNGATLAEIAEVLGHKTLQMVKRYAHLTEQHTSKVVARMNEKIFSGKP
jgi:integrase